MEELNRFQPYLLSVLRIMVGLLFMQHGLSKLFDSPLAQVSQLFCP